LLFTSCDSEDPIVDEEEEMTLPEKFDVVGVFEMNDGPTDLAVKDNFAFAGRDDKIYVIDLSNVNSPALIATIDDVQNTNIFQQLLVEGDYLYAACSGSSGIYVIDVANAATPIIQYKYLDDIVTGNKLKAFSLFYENNTLWAGGSNGQNAFLVEYKVAANGELTQQNNSISPQSGNAIGGVWANNNHVFISMANGYVNAFDKTDINAGPVGSYTFTNEPGHEHWGRALVGHGNELYWADWGAGFVTIDISDPNNLVASNTITHSSFTTQHASAEGTNVYDIAFDASTNSIYLANGWSGLLEVKASSTNLVNDYVDYKDNMYRCIALYGNYVLTGDIAAGTTDVKGVKIIKVK